MAEENTAAPTGIGKKDNFNNSGRRIGLYIFGNRINTGNPLFYQCLER